MIAPVLGQAAAILDPLGQPEVGDVRPALLVEQDVGRLEVAVQDAALVGVVHGRGDLGHQPRHGPGIAGGLRPGAARLPPVRSGMVKYGSPSCWPTSRIGTMFG